MANIIKMGGVTMRKKYIFNISCFCLMLIGISLFIFNNLNLSLTSYNIYMIFKIYILIPLFFLFLGNILGYFLAFRKHININNIIFIFIIILFVFFEIIALTHWPIRFYIIKYPYIYILPGALLSFLITLK